ncbi:growth-regulating factor 1 isoform X2 [Malus domestica]|uniref:growth-regulating factor 1 isoform X2 n=1 Tax=Malus domestica TaxID=3750 RepID=UPI003974FA45
MAEVSGMDFGLMGLEGLVGPDAGGGEAAGKVGDGSGSASAKQQRSWPVDDDWRTSKMPKNEDLNASRTMPLQYQGTPLLRSNSQLLPPPAETHRQEQMLSFSNNKSEVSFLSKDGDFAYYQRNPTPILSPYPRNAGSPGYGSLNLSMHGPLTGARGPFTPSQWIELEHQALIYKYMTSNVPVPSNLLIPLKKPLYPYGLSGPSNPTSTWGAYHLGFSGNNDPEPGRCRRTDGKKWRCSRDAVADQKYCERHINRGRHRSRKPVEGQPGQAVSGTSNSKRVPMNSSMSTSVMASNGASNSITTAPQQFKRLQTAVAANPSSADAFVNSVFCRMQDPRGLSVMSAPTLKPKSNNSTSKLGKQEFLVEESSQSEFGIVSTYSLLNPSHRNSYISKDFGGSFLDFSDQETQDQHPLRQFMDDWPKDQSSHSVSTWPEEIKSDWTQLSMSIPMASSEFSSSSSSPTHEKLALSPLRLSREFVPAQMNLGMSNDLSESSQKQTNWIPIPWGNSMGGPLGEVITNTTSSGKIYNNSTSPLNLLNEGWDGNSQLGSSPTGVLQKSTFCSLSNSSSGSSPRGGEIKKSSLDGASIYDDVLGSTFASSPVPSL